MQKTLSYFTQVKYEYWKLEMSTYFDYVVNIRVILDSNSKVAN